MSCVWLHNRILPVLTAVALFCMPAFMAFGTAKGDMELKLKALESAYKAEILSEEEYERKKAAPEAELNSHTQGPGESAPKKPETLDPEHVKQPVANKGALFNHPIGFSLWYPQGWNVFGQEDGFQLVPPNNDPKKEIYLLIGESVSEDDIVSPDDPGIIQYLDELLKGLAPALKLSNNIVPIPIKGGKGIMIEWQALGPDGQAISAKAFTSIIKGFCVSLIAFGLKENLDERDSELRQIFSSFGSSKGKTDSQIVGTWRLVSTASIYNESPFETDWSRAKMASESKSELIFYPDGTWSRTDTSRLIAGAGDIWIDSGDQVSSHQGHWNAADGLLYMMWQNGSWEEYKYRIKQTAQGRSMRLASGNRGEVWETTN